MNIDSSQVDFEKSQGENPTPKAVPHQAMPIEKIVENQVSRSQVMELQKSAPQSISTKAKAFLVSQSAVTESQGNLAQIDSCQTLPFRNDSQPIHTSQDVILEEHQTSNQKPVFDYCASDDQNGDNETVKIPVRKYLSSVNSPQAMDDMISMQTTQVDQKNNKGHHGRNNENAISYEQLQPVVSSVKHINGIKVNAILEEHSSQKTMQIQNEKRLVSLDSSNSVEMVNARSNTEIAPSDCGGMTVEQQGLVLVTLSDAMNKQDLQSNQVVKKSEDDKKADSIQGDEEERFKIDREYAAVLVNRSQEAQRQTQTELGLQPDSTNNLNDKLNSQAAAVSDKTENNGEVGKAELQATRVSRPHVIKRESQNGLSSNNSHQHTRSAVDKGNFGQQDTDPSIAGANNEDQSSHISQYFNQLEHGEEPDRVEISKQVILENEEFYQGAEANADHTHFDSLMSPKEISRDQKVSSIRDHKDSLAITELAERSKESTDQNMTSQVQLEYSKSMNMIEIEETAPLVNQQQPIEETKDDYHSSIQSSGRKKTGLNGLLEKTPQFHGSSPVIFEANVEESTIEAAQQQPNYESDTGMINQNNGANLNSSRITQQIATQDVQSNTREQDQPIPQPIDRSQNFTLENGSQDEVLILRRCTLESGNDYNERTIPNSDEAYELQTSMKILPGSDNYNPNICNSDSKESMDIANHIGAEERQKTDDETIKVVDDRESPEFAAATNQKDRSRYKKEFATQQVNTSIDSIKRASQANVGRNTDLGMRVSSRFSKGYQEELDRVAERINKSILLNSQSCNESIRREDQDNRRDQRNPFAQESSDQSGSQDDDFEQNDSTELPPGARRSPHHKVSQKSRTTSQMQGTIQDVHIIVREQDTPKSRHPSSSFPSRRSSRLNEPRFPDPVQEARQRYSTPRHASQSPISNKNASFKSGSNNTPSRKIAYPVEIRKNKVIKGPVLKNHYENVTIQNGKLKIAVQKRRKTQERVAAGNVNNHMGSTTDDSLMVSSRQPRQSKSTNMKPQQRNKSKPQNQTNHTAAATLNNTKSRHYATSQHNPRDDSQNNMNDVTRDEGSLEAQTPSTLLPKKRIKPAAVKKQTVDTSKSRERTKFKQDFNKTQQVLGQKRGGGPQGDGGRNNAKSTKSRNKESCAKSPSLNASRKAAQQQQQQQVSTNIDETQQTSLISAIGGHSFFLNSKSDVQFDQPPKSQRGAITIDDSTIDPNGKQQSIFLDSMMQKTSFYGGISHHDISQMPIDQIYQQLSKNWNKDRMAFEQKCKDVLEESKMQSAVTQQNILTKEQAKNRQQRFDLLKQRLMQNGKVQKRKKSANNELSDEQALLKENMKQLENVVFQDSEAKNQQQNVHQLGQFQLIFNKPETFKNTAKLNLGQGLPSPRRDYPMSEHRSQHQLKQPNSNSSWVVNKPTNRQRSQVLTPKIASSFFDQKKHQSVVPQHVIAMNMTPDFDEHQHLNLQQFNQPVLNNQASLPMSKSVMKVNDFYKGAKSASNNLNEKPSTTTTTNSMNMTLANFIQRRGKNNQSKTNAYFGEMSTPNSISGVPMVPNVYYHGNTQTVRAATANNMKKRPPVLQDAFNNSAGFIVSASNSRRGGSRPQTKNNIRDDPLEKRAISPESADYQQKLLQKLQYRSMRGRRIQEYLQNVQSQKIKQTDGLKFEPKSFEQNPIDLQIESNFSDSTQKRGTQIQSQSSIQQQQEDYNVLTATASKAALIRKLQNSFVVPSEDGNSLNQLESRNDMSILLQSNPTHTQKTEDFYNQAASTQQIKQRPPMYQRASVGMQHCNRSNTSSTVFNTFLAQQDKRIDFGLCHLYQKVRDGHSLDLHSSAQDKFLKVADLEQVMNFIKRKNLQTLTRPFQLKAHSDCYTTIQKLLMELGMGYRVNRMMRDESEIDIERVYVMACRAHKLHRARIDLVGIFDLIIQLEDKLPRIKQLIMNRLARSSNKVLTSMNDGTQSEGRESSSAVFVDEKAKIELEQKGKEVKSLLSQLIIQIPALLKGFKFFNDSFVFNDKDYLKYLSKETIEIKGLLSVYNIRF